MSSLTCFQYETGCFSIDQNVIKVALISRTQSGGKLQLRPDGAMAGRGAGGTTLPFLRFCSPWHSGKAVGTQATSGLRVGGGHQLRGPAGAGGSHCSSETVQFSLAPMYSSLLSVSVSLGLSLPTPSIHLSSGFMPHPICLVSSHPGPPPPSTLGLWGSGASVTRFSRSQTLARPVDCSRDILCPKDDWHAPPF